MNSAVPIPPTDQIARSLVRQGHPTLARAFLEASLRRNPADDIARALLDALRSFSGEQTTALPSSSLPSPNPASPNPPGPNPAGPVSREPVSRESVEPHSHDGGTLTSPGRPAPFTIDFPLVRAFIQGGAFGEAQILLEALSHGPFLPSEVPPPPRDPRIEETARLLGCLLAPVPTDVDPQLREADERLRGGDLDLALHIFDLRAAVTRPPAPWVVQRHKVLQALKDILDGKAVVSTMDLAELSLPPIQSSEPPRAMGEDTETAIGSPEIQAQLLVEEGFVHQAIRIYERLAMENPARYGERLATLRRRFDHEHERASEQLGGHSMETRDEDGWDDVTASNNPVHEARTLRPPEAWIEEEIKQLDDNAPIPDPPRRSLVTLKGPHLDAQHRRSEYPGTRQGNKR